MFKNLLTFLREKNKSLNKVSDLHFKLENDLKSPKVNLGQIQTHLNNQKSSIKNLSEVEFQVFSQWGDDGIIQYLINKIEIPNKTFIEFGVENYKESNTRFLIINNNWSGYVIDGSKENIKFINGDIISWACELYYEAAFINKTNINDLLKKPGFDPEIGLLSIDIDGNDYWIWKEIDCLDPIIVIAEYNSVFGSNKEWTIPYDDHFVRTNKHSSNLYYGASLKALYNLAKQKGYSFIGCNSKGNNAYFVRNDKVGIFQTKTVEEGFVRAKFREAVINNKRVSASDKIKILDGMEIYDIATKQLTKIDSSTVIY
jgi:hypothetical protein